MDTVLEFIGKAIEQGGAVPSWVVLGLVAALVYQTLRVAAAEKARTRDRETLLRDIATLTQTIERLTLLDRLTNAGVKQVTHDACCKR